MKRLIIFFIATLVLFSTVSACWGWLIYYKPAFRGKVIDAETKAPIEGAVVVALYWKEYLVGGPGGPRSTIFSVRETLTDSKGEFHIPSLISFTPFSRDLSSSFIIYKPGYMYSEGPSYIRSGTLMEKFFSSGAVGQVGEIQSGYGTPEVWKGLLGVVELQRAKTSKEAFTPGAPMDYHSDKLPLFFKAINEDRKRRGLEGELK